ncbi:glycosyltransferase [Arthrobacter globiformis]|uniref:glycosyltransferase n=1 Tax=Arthrobacter globiformis TaxID=1665 RepID=UPI0021D53914|nr:glycosyltransferase [Arthrobacter globiformis]
MPAIKRVAFLSLHSSPMEQPGSGDAGGMNVYIRGLAAALAESGVEVDIFTRATSAGQPAVERPDPGVRVYNVTARKPVAPPWSPHGWAACPAPSLTAGADLIRICCRLSSPEARPPAIP